MPDPCWNCEQRPPHWEKQRSLSSKKPKSLSTHCFMNPRHMSLRKSKTAILFHPFCRFKGSNTCLGYRTRLWQSPTSRAGQTPGKSLLSSRFLRHHMVTHLFTLWANIHWMLTPCQALSCVPGQGLIRERFCLYGLGGGVLDIHRELQEDTRTMGNITEWWRACQVYRRSGLKFLLSLTFANFHSTCLLTHHIIYLFIF